MYSCAPRDINFASCQTTRNVGPTTYDIPDGPFKKVNVVPFLSSEKKEPKFYSKPICETFYELPGSITASVKGCSTPRNRAPRFVFKESDTPSPGTYDPKLQGKCKRVVPCGVRPKKLYVCRVPFTTKGSTPSMPIDSYGYLLTENDSVLKVPPKERDNTLGPAYYHINSGLFSEPNKGCKWSGRTEQRSFYKVESNPGPGTYDVELPKCIKRVEEEEFREMARRFSFLPRYIEAQEMHVRKEGLPGPGCYCLCNRDICRKWPGIKPSPFVTGSKRFTTIVSENPGPGRYDIGTVKYSVSKKDVPFSVESSRFTSKKANESPGPAYYDIKSPLYEKLLKKENACSLFDAPFNNTAKRDTLAISPDAAITPSPADYNKELQGKCKILASSMFKSKTVRFKRLCRKNEASPATYDVIEAFNSNNKHVSHQAVEVSFNATARRKGIIEENNIPGPADYSSSAGLNTKGYYFPVSQRWAPMPLGPGPGTYYIHPSYENSLYGATKTFNLRIKESVLKKKLRRSPNETYGKWASSLKKKKRLKCFFLPA